MFKKTLFILMALSLLLVPFTFAGERVVTVGGNQATRPISDFNLTPSERAVGGDVYYVDGNRLTDLGNGKSWRFAFQKLSTALAASHADIAVSADRQWAARNVIYVKGDPGASFDEDLTKLAQKTDIVGVGSADGNKGPRLLGIHTIEAATQGNYMGCRFINFTFKASTNSHIFQIPTNQNGIEFINCTFEASADATYGIQATGAQDLVVSGCNFKRDVGNNYGFITAAIDIGNVDVADIYIENNFIDSRIGIVIDSGISTLGCKIQGNTILATTLTIDDNSDSFYIIKNTLVSLETYGANSYHFNEALAAGNIITASNGTYNLPVFADITAIQGDVTLILDDTNATIPASITIIDEFHDVPGADNTNNAQINEVIGNKADAVTAGAVTADRTLVAYAKQNVTANIAIETHTGTDIPGTITTLQADIDGLDELMANPTADTDDPVDLATEVVDNSVLSHIMTDDGDSSDYDRRYHSLEALAKTLQLYMGYELLSVAGSGVTDVIAIWYVDSNIGAAGDGKTPATAFQTITEAIAECTDAADDWVLVFDYGGGAGTITVNKANVHLIGNRSGAMPYPRLMPATALPAFTITDAGDRVEITGFTIGGGDQTVAAINFSGPAGSYGVWIHDNVIGRDAEAPCLYGIHIPNGTAAPYLVIENNRFYGSAGAGIPTNGSAILFEGNATRCRIEGNYISDIGAGATPAIWLNFGVTAPLILNNQIKVNDDTSEGSAITLASGVVDAWVNGNVANEDDTACDTVPFKDEATATNGWGMNYQDIRPCLPN